MCLVASLEAGEALLIIWHDEEASDSTDKARNGKNLGTANDPCLPFEPGYLGHFGKSSTTPHRRPHQDCDVPSTITVSIR
ncbi:hypothetical protein CVT26_014477 [Gymnopilus dilepis]|uniref:Uncharacterized protein n=1 Tax=Gymnopilus dilepis TaxID=231916 RepID=A0A409VVF2_9AGAR|nr:hypothetical protein CVT26_014477 [Gymnopilus dilepis]